MELAKVNKSEIAAIRQNLIAKNQYSILEANFCNKRVLSSVWKDTTPETYKDVTRVKTPNFGQISKYFGRAYAKGVIYVVIDEFFKDFSDMDKKLIAAGILEDVKWVEVNGKQKQIGGYPGFTIMDLKLCFFKGLQGKYGKEYSGYKVSDIVGEGGWLDQYYEWRKLASLEVEESKEKIEVNNAVPMPEDIKQKMDKMYREGIVSKMKSKNVAGVPVSFGGLIDYCNKTGRDYVEFMHDNQIEWCMKYKELNPDIDIDSFISLQKKYLLIAINKKWKTKRKEAIAKIELLESVLKLYIRR